MRRPLVYAFICVELPMPSNYQPECPLMFRGDRPTTLDRLAAISRQANMLSHNSTRYIGLPQEITMGQGVAQRQARLRQSEEFWTRRRRLGNTR